MKFFNPDNNKRSARHRKIYAYAETAYTAVDFIAAVLFVVGSILFFDASTTYTATWLFFLGSILFGMRPTIKLVQRHQRSPDFSPGKPCAGCGVDKSSPTERVNDRNSSLTATQTVCEPASSGPVSQQPSR